MQVFKAIIVTLLLSLLLGVLIEINRVGAILMYFAIVWWVYDDARRLHMTFDVSRAAYSPHTWALVLLVFSPFAPIVFFVYFLSRFRIRSKGIRRTKTALDSS